ncbi:RNA-binding protein [bacterium]|nr:RNA-binding protein [bacterium]
MNIYVGNLPKDLSEADLKAAFEAYGQVESAKIIKDRYSGESRGFGFVEMPSQDEAKEAMEAMNGSDLKGSTLKVNEARPRTPRRRPGGGGNFGGRPNKGNKPRRY